MDDDGGATWAKETARVVCNEDRLGSGSPMTTGSTARRRRGPLGWIVFAFFWAYNALMAVWLAAGIVTMETEYQTAATEAERDAMAAGLAVGAGVILVVWSLGALLLGMLMLATRRNVSRGQRSAAMEKAAD